MKIVLPYISQVGETLEDNIITGGVEKHVLNIYKEFNCIPFEVGKHETRNYRNIIKRLELIIESHKPDIVYNNYLMKSFDSSTIPTLKTMHVLQMGGFLNLNYINYYNDRKSNHSFAGVSKLQERGFDELSQRLRNNKFVFDFITCPDYVKEKHIVEEPEYDFATIGRLEEWKDPLFLGKIAKDYDYKCFTTSIETEIGRSNTKAIKYLEKNKIPEENHYTDYPHDKIMNEISKSKVYVSTWPHESFGVAIMEALSKGVPCILCTKNNKLLKGKHASEEISPSPEYIRVIHKSSPKEEFIKAYEELSKLDRQKIADDTYEKHNKSKWKKQYEDAFRLTIERST